MDLVWMNEWNTQTKSNPFTIPRKQSVKMPFGLSTADASCEILQARNYILIQINCFPNYTVLVRVIEGWVTFRTHIFCCIFKLHQSWKKLDGAHKKFTLHTINDIFSHVSRETWFTPNMWKTLKIKRKKFTWGEMGVIYKTHVLFSSFAQENLAFCPKAWRAPFLLLN